MSQQFCCRLYARFSVFLETKFLTQNWIESVEIVIICLMEKTSWKKCIVVFLIINHTKRFFTKDTIKYYFRFFWKLEVVSFDACTLQLMRMRTTRDKRRGLMWSLLFASQKTVSIVDIRMNDGKVISIVLIHVVTHDLQCQRDWVRYLLSPIFFLSVL